MCWHSWKDEPQAGENSLFSSRRSLDVLSLAVPTSVLFRLFTNETVTDELITVLCMHEVYVTQSHQVTLTG